MPHHGGPDAAKGHLTQGQAPRVSDDGDDREPDDGQSPQAIEAEHVGLADGGGKENGDDDRTGAEKAGTAPRGAQSEFSAP